MNPLWIIGTLLGLCALAFAAVCIYYWVTCNQHRRRKHNFGPFYALELEKIKRMEREDPKRYKQKPPRDE